MNICFAIGTLNYSGAEKIVRHLINKLNDGENRISVMLMSCSSPIPTVPKEVVQYPLYVDPGVFKNPLMRVARRINGIRNVVNNNNFDVVISFGVVFNMDVALGLVGSKTRLILCERNDPVYDPRSKIQRLRRALTYPLADGYVFQTETIKKFFSKDIQSKSVVIPNFIEETIDQSDTYHPLRQAWATSARLDDNQKNQKTLIKAFSLFAKTHPNYKLEMYGDGPDRRKLEEYASECGVKSDVLFMGRVKNPMHEIRSCKGFILTSKFEGMPNALIEAMAYAMPCISTDCGGGGAKALITDTVNGLLLQNDKPETIAAAMSRLSDDDEYATRLGLNAYRINEELNIDKIINKWTAYFDDVVRGANANK